MKFPTKPHAPVKAATTRDARGIRGILRLSTRQHPSTWARDTLRLLEQATPAFIPLELWPVNSPDLNPVDYRQEKMSKTEVLQIYNITGIEAFLITVQLRWTGHVLRMGDNTLPKAFFCSALEEGTRYRGGQRKRYKDMLKANLKRCNIGPPELDRSDWRSHCETSVQQFEAGRVRTLETKREQRKTATYLNDASFPCNVCGRSCASRIGLYARRRTHLPT